MRVVPVVTQKGGVGKTTTAMSLAAICAEATRVLVVDVDPQGSASWWADNAGERLPFDFTTEADPQVLARMRDLAADRYDVLIVDTPGSLEGHQILQTILANSDYAVVPTEASPLAVEPLIRTVRTVISSSSVPYRVLVNKVDGRAVSTRDDVFAMLDAEGITRFRASTRQLSAHTYAPAEGLVVTQYPRERYAVEAAAEYRRVALEMFVDWSVSASTPAPLAVAARAGEATPA